VRVRVSGAAADPVLFDRERRVAVRSDPTVRSRPVPLHGPKAEEGRPGPVAGLSPSSDAGPSRPLCCFLLTEK
jgi:hypothetical protein